ncbi:Protein of unknown function (DUF3343) [Acididesulfobacillus acetoxydans]|uniref:Putative Se/S carrier protein-like domain-containing protein n=1 Tax=Acididesulfobacillus acetoxydans TaxID=1561005 RepID=A0A8S0XBQ9_9FIRM|nr:DUF3343 domain-containing protein [Acididesulfobacillus acetoxydans]CAA7601516.1 Protein of unknown function (DUF3343) [Acididesulfobacillus acetoxydans]CEJ07003.1 Protein of unknown function (DUF3343) [Acididesulfobacillus acetoxydans]
MLYGKLKDYRALLTFPSLTEALGAERILDRSGCPFASIPTPRSLRSGCNTSLCLPLERKEIIDDLIDDGVVFTGVYEAREDGFAPLTW